MFKEAIESVEMKNCINKENEGQEQRLFDSKFETKSIVILD